MAANHKYTYYPVPIFPGYSKKASVIRDFDFWNDLK